MKKHFFQENQQNLSKNSESLAHEPRPTSLPAAAQLDRRATPGWCDQKRGLLPLSALSHQKSRPPALPIPSNFKLKKLPSEPVYIDLGKVMVMARVKVNGENVGGVWTAPYRLNISDFLKKGENTLEVEVVNCWRNRLIGEKEVIPESERFTFQTSTYLSKDDELQSSGLLGPVRLLSISYTLF